MIVTCPYCREAIAEENSVLCPTCTTAHHIDCWNENGGCTVFGCVSAPPEEDEHVPSGEPAIPASTTRGAVPSTESLLEISEGGRRLVSNVMRDRRAPIRNMLFLGLVSMPICGLIGALLGLILGVLFVLFGSGFGKIIYFPMAGLCLGQLIGAATGIGLAVILGEIFVAHMRKKILIFADFVFKEIDSPKERCDTENNEYPVP